jgi:hypothetical protein
LQEEELAIDPRHVSKARVTGRTSGRVELELCQLGMRELA